MRAAVLGLALMVAAMGGAEARDCSGQGSAQVLTFSAWSLSASDKSSVEVTYSLHDDKTIMALQAHLYFQIAPDDVLADAAFELTNEAGVAHGGTRQVSLPKDAIRRLQLDVGDVALFACTNTIEYLDGSGVIID